MWLAIGVILGVQAAMLWALAQMNDKIDLLLARTQAP